MAHRPPPLAGRLVAALLAAAFAAAPPAAHACGSDSDCVVGDRSYRIAVPDGAGPFGVILFLHGYGAHTQDIMDYADLRAVAAQAGAALIAPQGIDGRWSLAHSPRNGDAGDGPELDAIDAMLADAEARFPLDRTRVLATGFSAGAAVVWTLACRRAAEFAGFVPMAGTFWSVLPDDCAKGPVNVLYVHGRGDDVVPLAGDKYMIGVDAVLEGFRTAGGFTASTPATVVPGLDCTAASDPSGHSLDVCLHDGGHEIVPAAIAAAWQMFVHG